MSELPMRERIARALREWDDGWTAECTKLSPRDWSQISGAVRERYLAGADAVLAEMAEPTALMCDGVWVKHGDLSTPWRRHVWAAMVEAAQKGM